MEDLKVPLASRPIPGITSSFLRRGGVALRGFDDRKASREWTLPLSHLSFAHGTVQRPCMCASWTYLRFGFIDLGTWL